MITEGLTYNSEGKYWIVRYSWIKDPNDLPNNIAVAIARMKCTERLNKVGSDYMKMYYDQNRDMVNRGVAKKGSLTEMNAYKGPVHYTHHHEVLKQSSTSTPFRIVFNSSADYKGHILNDYWAKGRDILNDLVGLLLRLRQNNTAVVGDIAKMYNAVKLEELEQYTHRIVWRDVDSSKTPEHYMLTAVAFRDRSSGVIAATALKKLL